MKEKIVKFCKKHGMTTHTLYKTQYRCNKCMVDYDYEKRHRIKEMLVEYKGGKCELCGYDKCINALEFHHINPEEKEFALNTANYNKSMETLKKEVNKCLLVCSNCHREIHYKENEERRKNIVLNIEDVIDNSVRKQNNKKLDVGLIKKDIENNIFQSEIAKKYGVSVSTLKRFIKSNNLTKSRIKIAPEDVVKIYEQALCYTKLAKEVGCTVKVIKKYCIDNNLIEKLNCIREKNGLKKLKNKHNFK